MECSVQHHECGFTQQETTHVDLDDITGDPILLDTIAHVVELCEGCAHLVCIITEMVRGQVVQDFRDDLRETNNTLG